MDLTDRELRELALFFAKRMDTSLALRDPSDPPPPGDPRAAWVDKLSEAQNSGRLSGLMTRISSVDPDDENLQSACALLRAPDRRFETYSVGLALVGGTGVLLLAITAAAGVLAASALFDQSETVVEIASAVDTETLADLAAPQREIAATETVSEAPDIEANEAPDTAPVPPPERLASAPVSMERCTKTSGGVVGYWYAGEMAPGTAGETVTVPHAVNVRADYPDVHNNFDARAHINCVLQEGDVVRLSRDPILVPADRYWIPLMSGDLLASG